jgi:hypothetical protein
MNRAASVVHARCRPPSAHRRGDGSAHRRAGGPAHRLRHVQGGRSRHGHRPTCACWKSAAASRVTGVRPDARAESGLPAASGAAPRRAARRSEVAPAWAVHGGWHWKGLTDPAGRWSTAQRTPPRPGCGIRAAAAATWRARSMSPASASALGPGHHQPRVQQVMRGTHQAQRAAGVAARRWSPARSRHGARRASSSGRCSMRAVSEPGAVGGREDHDGALRSRQSWPAPAAAISTASRPAADAQSAVDTAAAAGTGHAGVRPGAQHRPHASAVGSRKYAYHSGYSSWLCNVHQQHQCRTT